MDMSGYFPEDFRHRVLLQWTRNQGKRQTYRSSRIFRYGILSSRIFVRHRMPKSQQISRFLLRNKSLALICATAKRNRKFYHVFAKSAKHRRVLRETGGDRLTTRRSQQIRSRHEARKYEASTNPSDDKLSN